MEYLQKTKELDEGRIRFYENFIKIRPSDPRVPEVVKYLKFIKPVNNIFEKKWRYEKIW